jgi:hypothetical protein
MSRAMFWLVASALVCGGCTTVHKAYDSQGRPTILVECGAALSMGLCHDRAAKECPGGYSVVREQAGINRKTLEVACK